MVNEFVEKIIVREKHRKGSYTSKQKIEIYFNFIGSYLPKKEPLSKKNRKNLMKKNAKSRNEKTGFIKII